MPLIRHKASRPAPYNGPEGAWPAGEAREVSAERAAYLLGPLAAWFELAEPPAPAPLEVARNDRQFKKGHRKG